MFYRTSFAGIMTVFRLRKGPYPNRNLSENFSACYNEKMAVIEGDNVEKQVVDLCDETCLGTETDLSAVKQKMVDESSANQLAELFKALSDPTRVKIIGALLQTELCVHDISVLLGMGQSAISHQLRYLRNLRLVKRRKSGKTVFYSLDDTHIEQIFVLTLQHLKHD
jgi:ArsR family transcriptional regulator, lead/cadmium/zinc/bismuth-responsive transcriptional repressor